MGRQIDEILKTNKVGLTVFVNIRVFLQVSVALHYLLLKLHITNDVWA